MKVQSICAAIVMAILTPAAASAESFTGPRVQVTAGWDQLRFDLARYGPGRDRESDLAWGVEAGYDVALGGNFVAGLQAGLSTSNVGHAYSDATASHQLDARRDYDLSARLGMRIGGNALLYGRAGYTNFRIGDESTIAGVTTAGATNLDGVLLGAGVEVAITPAAYLTSEFRYSNYQDGISRNQIRTGLGLRF
ncbi:MAG: outer rane immunogenic protein [Sphingomonadales bacterium]|nr:outer rane immunogenic protein [Sphingomonadales bacterium]